MNSNAAEYLMIEDNKQDVEITLFDFEINGKKDLFYIAQNCEDAMDYLFAEDGSLKIEPPKAIFLDLHMPKVSAFEFLHIIKSNKKTENIPVVVLKSSISPVELDQCHQLGVKHFIEKPLEYENFTGLIGKLQSCF